LASAVVSCGLITEVCTRELGVVLAPRDTIVEVGAEFEIVAYGTSCGGKETLTLDVAWESTDSDVISVTETGLVRAHSSGVASARGHDRSRWGVQGLEVTVTVQ